jgi:hypothetical protein
MALQRMVLNVSSPRTPFAAANSMAAALALFAQARFMARLCNVATSSRSRTGIARKLHRPLYWNKGLRSEMHYNRFVGQSRMLVRTSPSVAARRLRQQRYKRRQKDGSAILRVAIPDYFGLLEALILAGRLSAEASTIGSRSRSRSLRRWRIWRNAGRVTRSLGTMRGRGRLICSTLPG